MTAQLPLPIPAAETGHDGSTPIPECAGAKAVDREACEAIRALARMALLVPRDDADEAEALQSDVWAVGHRIAAVVQRAAEREARAAGIDHRAGG